MYARHNCRFVERVKAIPDLPVNLQYIVCAYPTADGHPCAEPFRITQVAGEEGLGWIGCEPTSNRSLAVAITTVHYA
jgi:hypothetical protein